MPKRNTYLAPAKAMLKHVGRRALDIDEVGGSNLHRPPGIILLRQATIHVWRLLHRTSVAD